MSMTGFIVAVLAVSLLISSHFVMAGGSSAFYDCSALLETELPCIILAFRAMPSTFPEYHC